MQIAYTGPNSYRFFYCVRSPPPGSLSRSIKNRKRILNAELSKKALEKVGNPNILVNLISRRVRQLNSGGSRPLIEAASNVGVADIALMEIIEDKMGWEMLTPTPEELASTPRKRKKG